MSQKTPPATDGSDIAARERLILGDPPRILPLSGPGVDEVVIEHTNALRKGVLGGAPPLALADIPEIMPTLLRHRDLWERVFELSIQLMTKGVLAARDRELAILRIAWLWQAPYEWGEHVGQARKAGLTSDEIERITVGSAAGGWCEHDLALLRATEELHAGAMISDDTWALLAKRLDEKQLFELTVLIGQFTNVAFFQNSLKLRLPVGSEGLRAR